MARIDAFLKLGLAQGCSDVHLAVGVPPMLRMNGDLMPIKFRALSDTELETYIHEILSQAQKERLAQGHDLDFSYVAEEGGRFRVNVFRKITGVGAVFRFIPGDVPSLEKLDVPPVLARFCDYHQGMVLVTGSTGTGKSTTLAAMINHINERRNMNIISLEDPIEFVHPSKKSQVIQREVGTHVHSFADGVRSAMREDPDVILVGEMRDLETISIAVTAAEMGILVMGTLHTNGAGQTVDRIVNSFPADKQSHIRTMISTSLKGVISQQLLPTKNKAGRVAALEILINTPAVGNLIRQGKLDQLETAMQSGGGVGMLTMDSALMNLVSAGRISGKDAYLQANNKAKFERMKDEA
mgnify:CR=1 FL=1